MGVDRNINMRLYKNVKYKARIFSIDVFVTGFALFVLGCCQRKKNFETNCHKFLRALVRCLKSRQIVKMRSTTSNVSKWPSKTNSWLQGKY